MRNLSRAAITFVACVGLVLSQAGEADAISVHLNATDGIPESSAATGPVVATGTLYDTSGKPLAGQAIVLWAWPTSAQLSLLAPGDAVKEQPITEAETDSSGRFTFRLQPTADVSEYTDPDGYVNYEISAADAADLSAGRLTWEDNFSQAAPPAPAPTPTPTPTPTSKTPSPNPTSGPIAPMLVSSASASVTATPATPPDFALKPIVQASPTYDTQTNATQEIATDQIADTDAAADQDGKFGCEWVHDKSGGDHYVAVGADYVDTGNANMTLTYLKGSTSKIGVAISYSGEAGSYVVSGEAESSAKSTQGFPTYTTKGKRIMWTQFHFTVYSQICGLTPSNAYEIRVTGWNGGTRRTTAPSYPTATHCVAELKTSKFTEDNSTANTWTAGANLGPIKVTAQTGYNTSTSQYTYFTGSGQLCGTNGKPGQDPSRLVAKD